MIDQTTVLAAFAEACPGTDVREVAELSAGYASKQWVLRTDEGPLLLKVPVRNTDPAHLRHLIAATGLAAELDLPVSRYRAFVPHSAVIDAPVLVQEFAHGEPASEVWKSLSPEQRTAAATVLGRWTGVLHTRRGPGFTDVLGARAYPSAVEQVRTELAGAVRRLRDAGVERGLGDAAALIDGMADESADATPRLCHHDFYLDNVLMSDGRPRRLLDFEHARYSDQFAEFGKIRELLFDWYPETEDPFLAGYQEFQQIDDAARRRMHLHIGLYNVVMCAYFARWQEKLVPTYLDRIDAWVRSDRPS